MLPVKLMVPAPSLTKEPPPLITPDKVPAVAALTVMLPVLPTAVVMLPVPETEPVVDVRVVVLPLPVVMTLEPRLRPTPGVLAWVRREGY